MPKNRFNNVLSRNVQIRVGTIVGVEDFPEANNPAYKLSLDLGPKLGIQQSSAQITNYTKQDLLGKRALCLTGIPSMKVGTFESAVVVCGFYIQESWALDYANVPNGSRLYA